MSRITDIFTSVRIDLGDTKAERYTNDILLRHLNSAVNDFVLATKCLKERIYVGLNYSSAIYDLRPYVLEFIRAEYNRKNIEAKSFTELDRIDPDWQTATGKEVRYITFEHLTKGMFRVYPRVEGTMNIVTQNNLYGGLIDITIGDDDYQIPSIEDVESNIDQYIVLYAVRKPSKLTLDSTAIDIDIAYDNALTAYVMAMCLRSDTDALNRQYGAEQLQLYSNYVESAKMAETIASNSINDRIVPYRGGFQ